MSVELHNRFHLHPVFSPDEIIRVIENLAAQISRDYAGTSLHLLIVLKGAFLFAADLARQIDLPISMDFIRIASYKGAQSTGGINLALKPHDHLTDRDILIIEDILDTGLSLDFLFKYIAEEQPRSLKSCVLVNKTGNRKISREPDYCGFTHTAGFLVGYGLDYDEQLRNLPGIYELG